jgi:glycosyltransferase involved in cell wall biosynthesis
MTRIAESPAISSARATAGGHQTHAGRQLHILHVVISLDAGGLERVVVDLVREARSRGYRADVLCLERPGALAGQALDAGAAVHCVDKPPGLRLAWIGRVGAVVRELDPHIVHTHQMGALFYAGTAARRAGVGAVVHTEHGKHLHSMRRRLLALWATRYCDRFFCVSEDIARDAIRVAPQWKLQVVRNGIDLAKVDGENVDRTAERARVRRDLAIPREAGVVGTVGRLAEVKNQAILLSAFKQVLLARPDAHLLIVGDGPLREQLIAQSHDLGIDSRVRFVGFKPDCGPYLRAMDVFCLTSLSEGMPLVILEAWAAGALVIASSVGGVPELVHRENTGYLFSSGDCPGLAGLITATLTDAPARQRIVSRSRQLVEDEFTLRHMADAYERQYESLLERAGEGRFSPRQGALCNGGSHGP